MLQLIPRFTLFPYTTLFRSKDVNSHTVLDGIITTIMATIKDVNSHTVLDGIITTIMATIQRINIIGRSEERFSRNAETDLVCRLLLEKKNKLNYTFELINPF